MSESYEPESVVVYQRLKAIFGDPTYRAQRRRNRRLPRSSESVPYGAGRDPRNFGAVLAALTTDMGWNSSLAQSDIISSWADLVGDETAKHSHPLEINDRVLTVRCDSTAWATQLRFMRVDIMSRISVNYPESRVETIRFVGPDVPSWKRGPRAVPGRGPRDTYG